MPVLRSVEEGRASSRSTTRSAIEDTSLGPMLLVEGDDGIRQLQFGNTRDELKQLRSSELRESDGPVTADFARLLQAVSAVVEGRASDFRFTLDPRGTRFQKLVWQYLLRIPSGMTISYRGLAERIGRPTSTRAVASACAANRIAILIPCHRVLRSDGGMGGYRWGVERKRQLLERESSGSMRSTTSPAILTNRTTAAPVSVAQAKSVRA